MFPDTIDIAERRRHGKFRASLVHSIATSTTVDNLAAIAIGAARRAFRSDANELRLELNNIQKDNFKLEDHSLLIAAGDFDGQISAQLELMLCDQVDAGFCPIVAVKVMGSRPYSIDLLVELTFNLP